MAHFICLLLYTCREVNATAKSPLVRTKSEDSGSPKLKRHQHHIMLRGTADAADIHICVLCIKALMNNAVSYSQHDVLHNVHNIVQCMNVSLNSVN